MTMPVANQKISRTQVGHGSDARRYRAESAPAGATAQIHGVRNARFSLGSRTRSTMIPMETITNASRVPIETRLLASRTVSRDETNATATPVMIEVIHGVRNRGWMLLTNGGSRPSRDIVQNTRDCPRSITRITDDSPMIAPNLMTSDIHPIPARSAATAIGSGTFSSL